MNTESKNTVPMLVKPVIKFIIVLVVLLVIRAIVAALPMIRDARISGFPLTPLQMAIVVVDTVIIVILLNFGRDIGNSLRFGVERFPEIGTIATLIVVLIAVSIAYTAYNDIGYLLPRNIHWIYPVLFAVLAVIPLYFLVMTTYRNVDKLTDLSVKKIEAATKKQNLCTDCGTKLPTNVQFCSNCGHEIAKAEETVKQTMKCPKCGTTADKDAKFCEECGAEIVA